MLAYGILLIAVLSRFFPHAMHGVGINLTAVGAGLLFFGSRRPRRETVAAVAVMAFSDFLLTRYVYGFPFHVESYLVTWAWYAAAVLLGSALLRKVTVIRVAAGVVASATGFFVLSNLMVWLGGMYAHTAKGLAECFVAALPFYGNDLVSTGLCGAVFFGVPVLARKMVGMMEESALQA